jgi:hypothetical protein
MSFDEFVQYFHILKNGNEIERLTLSFKIMDQNKSGVITKSDVFDIISLMSRIHQLVEGVDEKNDDEIEKIVDFVFERIDANGDGRISIEEFLTAANSADDVSQFFELICGKGFEGVFAYSKTVKERQKSLNILKILKKDVDEMKDYLRKMIESHKQGNEIEPFDKKIGRYFLE